MTSERITALRRTALFGSLGEEELRALAALELLAGRLRRHAELVEVLSLRAVGQRLARLLLREARARWEVTPDEKLDEHIQYIKRIAARHISWGDLGQLGNSSPGDAIALWKAIRIEARNEFISGHYGARAFETAEYMHEAFKRAQYLSI
jgi:hypothetical protein